MAKKTTRLVDIFSATEDVPAAVISKLVGGDEILPIYDGDKFIGTATSKPIDDGNVLLAKIQYTTPSMPDIVPVFTVTDAGMVINGYRAVSDASATAAPAEGAVATPSAEMPQPDKASAEPDVMPTVVSKDFIPNELPLPTANVTVAAEPPKSAAGSKTIEELYSLVMDLSAKVDTQLASSKRTTAIQHVSSSDDVWSKVLSKIK